MYAGQSKGKGAKFCELSSARAYWLFSSLLKVCLISPPIRIHAGFNLRLVETGGKWLNSVID